MVRKIPNTPDPIPEQLRMYEQEGHIRYCPLVSMNSTGLENGASARTGMSILATAPEIPLKRLFAHEIFSVFMCAVTKKIGSPIGERTIDYRMRSWTMILVCGLLHSIAICCRINYEISSG
jgi:hypothetical protein